MIRRIEKRSYARLALGLEGEFAAGLLGDDDILQWSALMEEQSGDGDQKAERDKHRQRCGGDARADGGGGEDGLGVHGDLYLRSRFGRGKSRTDGTNFATRSALQSLSGPEAF